MEVRCSLPTLSGRLLLLTLLIITTSHAVTDKPAMEALEWVLKPNDTLTVNCTLPEDWPYTAGDIVFKFSKALSTNNSFIQAISNKTAQLIYPNLPAIKTRPYLYCYVEEELDKFASEIVYVLAQPLPSVLECRVSHWEKLNCSWTPSYDEQKQHHGHEDEFQHQLTLKLYSGHEKVLLANKTFNPGDDGEAAVIWKQNATKYCSGELLTAYVSAVNEYHRRKNISEPFLSYGYSLTDVCTLVEPPPVNDVEATGNRSSTPYNSSTVHLSWAATQSPEGYLLKQFIYKLTIIPHWNDSIKIVTLNVTSYDLTTIPYGRVGVEVCVKPAVAGYWSKPKRLDLTAPSKRPNVNPKVSRFGFMMEGEAGDRTITVFWKPLPSIFHNGPDFRYKIQYQRLHSTPWSTYEHPVPGSDVERGVHQLSLRVQVPIKMRVIAYNDEGISVSDDAPVLNIPDKELVKVQDLYVLGVNETAVIHWHEPVYGENSSKRVGRSVKESPGYSLFWCIQASRTRCQRDLEWVSLPASVQEYKVELMGEVYTDLLYGVAVETASTAGITWSKRYHNDNKRPVAPRDFTVWAGSQGMLEISITTPTHVPDTGHIDAYIVRFCSTDSHHCQERKVPLKSGEEGRSVVDSWEVEPGTTYKVTVYSENQAGLRSDQSHNEITIETSKSWWTVPSGIGIAIVCFIALVFVCVGAVFTIKFFRKKKKKLFSVPISVPKAQETMLPNNREINEEPTSEYLRLMSTDSGVGNEDTGPLSPIDNHLGHMTASTRFITIPEDPSGDVFESPATANGAYLLSPNNNFIGKSTDDDVTLSDYAVIDDKFCINLPELCGDRKLDMVCNMAGDRGVGDGVSCSQVTDSISPYSTVLAKAEPEAAITSDNHSTAQAIGVYSRNPDQLVPYQRNTDLKSDSIHIGQFSEPPAPGPYVDNIPPAIGCYGTDTSFPVHVPNTDAHKPYVSNEHIANDGVKRLSVGRGPFPLGGGSVAGEEELPHVKAADLGSYVTEEIFSADKQLNAVNNREICPQSDQPKPVSYMPANVCDSIPMYNGDYVTDNFLNEMSSTREKSEAADLNHAWPSLKPDATEAGLEEDEESATGSSKWQGQATTDGYVTENDLGSLFPTQDNPAPAAPADSIEPGSPYVTKLDLGYITQADVESLMLASVYPDSTPVGPDLNDKFMGNKVEHQTPLDYISLDNLPSFALASSSDSSPAGCSMQAALSDDPAVDKAVQNTSYVSVNEALNQGILTSLTPTTDDDRATDVTSSRQTDAASSSDESEHEELHSNDAGEGGIIASDYLSVDEAQFHGFLGHGAVPSC